MQITNRWTSKEILIKQKATAKQLVLLERVQVRQGGNEFHFLVVREKNWILVIVLEYGTLYVFEFMQMPASVALLRISFDIPSAAT